MEKSKKKKEHDMLKETAAIYQSITRDSMDGFWIVDMNGHFLDVNDAYCQLTGYSRNELLKMDISDVEVERSIDEVIKQLRQIRKVGEFRFLTQHRKKDGCSIDIEASANYANYLGGFIFIFIRDISARKKTENELAKNRDRAKKNDREPAC